MDEPPAKRPRRDERDRDGDREVHNTASPRSPRPHDDRRHDSRAQGYDNRRRDNRDTRENDRRRKRSRSRSRSRSPVRDRRRERSRDRYRDRRDRNERDFKPRRKSRSRSRSRSRSPPQRNGARERSPGRGVRERNIKIEAEKKLVNVKGLKSEKEGVEAMDLVPVEGEDEEAAMKRVMGFGTFRTTKNTKVPGNQIYGVRKEKKTTYRQYMNRVGGFNRPLSPTRT